MLAKQIRSGELKRTLNAQSNARTSTAIP